MFFLYNNKKRNVNSSNNINKKSILKYLINKKIQKIQLNNKQEQLREKMHLLLNKELLKVYHFEKKTRGGINSDGGYVFGEIDSNYDCYISAGVSNEESFSRDFINKYHLNKHNSYAFDGTIDNYPYDYTDKITFVKKNINSFNDDNNTNLTFFIEKFDNIFLKMDIEGGEYPWLLNLSLEDQNKFNQMIIEFHGIPDDSWGYDNKDKMKCLEKILETHYIIHAHGNNFGYLNNGFPETIELTFLHKKFFPIKPVLNSEKLPVENLDYPNNKDENDIDLSFYPFCGEYFMPLKN